MGREREPLVTRKTVIPAASNLIEEQMEVNPPSSQTMPLRGLLALLGAWEAQQANAAR